MKTIKILFAAFIMVVTATATAQNAEEIVARYIETSGGEEVWKNLKATKMTASVTQGGMDIPVTIYNTREGKIAIIVNIQGQEITQLAFDGETMWTTNFMTMSREKSPEEMTKNMMLNKNDFPSPLVHYKENGYKLELIGNEIRDGKDTYKIKIVQEPVMVNGVETPGINYYYFDVENNLPVAMESTQENGQLINIGMSDYKEVGGLYFPYTMTQNGVPIIIKEIELNPEIQDSLFAFPAN